MCIIESINTGFQWKMKQEDVFGFMLGRRKAFYHIFIESSFGDDVGF